MTVFETFYHFIGYSRTNDTGIVIMSHRRIQKDNKKIEKQMDEIRKIESAKAEIIYAIKGNWIAGAITWDELCDDTLGEVNSPVYRKAFHELVEDGEIIVRKGVEWPGDLPPEVYVLKGCCAETVTSFTPYTDYTGDEPKEFEFDKDDN